MTAYVIPVRPVFREGGGGSPAGNLATITRQIFSTQSAAGSAIYSAYVEFCPERNSYETICSLRDQWNGRHCTDGHRRTDGYRVRLRHRPARPVRREFDGWRHLRRPMGGRYV